MKPVEAIGAFSEIVLGSLKYLASWLYPKDRNLWVFGAWFGEKYSDNSKYLFEYVLKHHPTIDALWVTNNDQVFEYLAARGVKVLKRRSLRGFHAICRAGVVVMTASTRDLDWHLVTTRSFNVQLWHGIGGNKKILYDTKQRQYPPLKKLVHRLVPFLRNELNYDLLVATSPLMQERFSGAFRLPRSRIPVLGYPRNDAFFTDGARQEHGVKTILYAPTHRGDGSGKTRLVIPSQEELEALSALMGRLKARFVFKFHFYDYSLIPDADYEHIEFLRPPPTDDPQQWLLATDLLIVDYSSIYFDYLLLDRPILFAPFDLEDYITNDRALYERYEDITPGPVARSWPEVMQQIEAIFQQPDAYGAQRRRLRDRYWTYVDGNSSKRVCNEILARTRAARDHA